MIIFLLAKLNSRATSLNIFYGMFLEFGHFFTTSGKLFQIKHPEYLMLCLKHSVLGFWGTKHLVDADLRFTDMFKLLGKL